MNSQYERFLEGNANALREKCGTGAFDRLDPFALATIMHVQVVLPDQGALDDETWQSVFVDGKDTWDCLTNRDWLF
jgi:hypothetical protein